MKSVVFQIQIYQDNYTPIGILGVIQNLNLTQTKTKPNFKTRLNGNTRLKLNKVVILLKLILTKLNHKTRL